MILPALVAANLKIIFRNRQSLFWALVFPLVFVGVFGLFNLDQAPSVTIGVIDRSQDNVSKVLLANLKQIRTFKLETKTDEAAARKQLQDGDLRYLLVIPPGLAASVAEGHPAQIAFTYDEASPTSAVVIGVIQRFLNDANLGLVQAPTLLNLGAEGIRSRQLNYFDFLLPGFVGLGVMTYSVIGIASVMTVYREQKILKRILATPLKVRTYFAGLIIAYLVMCMVQTAVILAAGILLLDGHVVGNYLYIGVAVLMGNIIFLSLGFIVGSFAKTVAAASGLGNVVTMPMMFLSGTFFPTDTLPSVLPQVVSVLPLSPMLEIMGGVSLDAKSLTDFPLQLGLLAIWIVVTSVVATRVFKFG